MPYAQSREYEHINEVLTRTSRLTEATEVVGEDLITRSWARCISDHGLDPTRQQPARILESAKLREHQEQLESFLRVARGGMEHLYKSVSPLGYVLLLTDASGVTVDYIGNDQWDQSLKKSGLCLGADWQETTAGTCGVGTCIVEQKPITCHQGDHFDATHIGLTCTSAPLFDPTGELLGVLDISALSSPSGKDSQHLAMHLTVGVAKMVEEANFIRHFGDKWIMRLGKDWTLVDVNGECMLAFDTDGQVVGANSGARQHLVARTAEGVVLPLVGRHLTEIFKTSMDQFWKIVSTGTTSDRTVLTTVRDQVFYAMARPPQFVVRKPQHRAEASPPVQIDCPALDQLAGDDKVMARLIDQAKRLVNKKVNILLHGETGTGKEVVARALHDSSNRAKKSFIPVNCASIPESLIESELFGYTAGSFTGGRSKGSRGLILQSDGGTLFLDEIGDMPLQLQTRLLRVLSEREVMPLGADSPVPVDLTVVAASHRDLRRLIAEGTFREDLYYRLCGATLYLPALRSRADKEFVIARLMQQEGEQMGCDAEISDDALAMLLNFSWPGNIRQLRNVIRFALAVCSDGYIDTCDLPHELDAEDLNPHYEPAGHVASVIEQPFQSRVQPVSAPQIIHASTTGDSSPEANNLISVLRRHHWNITAVSSELNICRATVYRHMKRLNIIPPTHH